MQSLGILGNFELLRPKNEHKQAELLKWLAKAHATANAMNAGETSVPNQTFERMDKFFTRFGCSPQKLGNRGVEVDDPQLDGFQDGFYKINLNSPSGPGMYERTKFFSEKANAALEKFYPENAKAPDHMIHVTCTGYVSPSPVQNIINHRGWNNVTAVTHAYHMGCYAAVPAVRTARGLYAANPQTIDIIHTELCSLHLNPADHSPEQMVVHSLFADGYIKYSYMPEADAKQAGFDVLNIKEYIIPNTTQFMTWVASDYGMKMTLSKEVPQQVGGSVDGFLKELLGDQPRDKTLFAIHPGGPRIIDSIQDLLQLTEAQVAHSKDILFRYGNMSSATLPHVWKSILEDKNIPSGQIIASLAFGPGLTIFGTVLRKR